MTINYGTELGACSGFAKPNTLICYFGLFCNLPQLRHFGLNYALNALEPLHYICESEDDYGVRRAEGTAES